MRLDLIAGIQLLKLNIGPKPLYEVDCVTAVRYGIILLLLLFLFPGGISPGVRDFISVSRNVNNSRSRGA
jgi:hypothetical protein